jgi:hypothetical protein
MLPWLWKWHESCVRTTSDTPPKIACIGCIVGCASSLNLALNDRCAHPGPLSVQHDTLSRLENQRFPRACIAILPEPFYRRPDTCSWEGGHATACGCCTRKHKRKRRSIRIQNRTTAHHTAHATLGATSARCPAALSHLKDPPPGFLTDIVFSCSRWPQPDFCPTPTPAALPRTSFLRLARITPPLIRRQRAMEANVPLSAAAACVAAANQPQVLPYAATCQPVTAVMTAGARCAGLEYANMKKEEAREAYKEKRREELLEQGEIERVKRRKKNDPSMNDDQKYHRRLKMNQDSAAAARHAQEAYVSTLERLVETAEAEKSILALESATLRAERNELADKLNALHHKVASSVPAVVSKVEATVDGGDGGPDDVEDHRGVPPEDFDYPSSALLLRKMMELFDSPEIPSAMTNDADFARGIMGIMPAPAV